MSSAGPVGKTLGFFEGFGINSAWILVALGGLLFFAVFRYIEMPSLTTFKWIFATAPIWLPITTFLLFFEYWMYYVRRVYVIAQGRVTLEIKIPQDVFKSPEAMEQVLIQLYQTASPDNHFQTYLDGKHPPTYGLEIVSRGGDVRFYMNVPRKKFKNIAEIHLYAQYPGIEIRELEVDYTAEIPWDPEKFQYFSIHFGLKKADALPIKTYVDYGLNDMPKEEEKIDPITTLIESFANIKEGEYVWTQILINAHRELNFKVGSLRKHADWNEEARSEIKKIMDTAQKRSGSEFPSMMQLTDTEKETVKAIERSLGKNPFNVVIRTMYIARTEAYLPGERIGPIITGWKAFDDLNRNVIGFKWRTDFDWNMWQDRHGHHKEALKKQELDEYKRRYYTNHSAKDIWKIMTTEELATIFHLPGKVLLTPGVGRIPSKRAEAPPNLPVG